MAPATMGPSTMGPSTVMPTLFPTLFPSTSMPTTGMPTTGMPTTGMPTTGMPTMMPTTGMPTMVPTTGMPTSATTAGLCDPNIDDFQPDTNDCTSYFICTQGHAFKVQCAQGLTFNAVTKACDWPVNHACKLPSGAATAPASITTTSPMPTTAMPTTPMMTSMPASTMQPTMQPTTAMPTTVPTTQKPLDLMNLCEDQGLTDGIHEDPTSCRYFIECANHITMRLACPPGTGFDKRFMICDYVSHIKGCV